MAKAKKVKVVKVDKKESTIIDLFTIPCKSEKVTGTCSFVVNGKVLELTGDKVNKIDIISLDMLKNKKPVIDLLVNLYNNYKLTVGRFTLKNQYGICIGICDSVGSYKAMLSYHAANNGLIVNGNKHFTYEYASNIAGK